MIDPSSTPAPQEAPARKVRARRVAFEYPGDDLPRHFMDGDLVMSHVVTVLSAMFPEGEDFFVRSVRNFRDEITDPVLREQVAGFIGQEAMHGREHRNFNERLARLGYPTRQIDRAVKLLFKIDARILPKRRQLAITAALEHYTATLAEVLMEDPRAQAAFGVDEVRSLFLWHALEESEHKAVAFDVYQAVGGSEVQRIVVMQLVTAGFVAAVLASTALSLAGDPAARDLPRLLRSLAALRRSPWLTASVYRNLRAYSRRGFHPDDRDATAMVERWRADLFGTGGTLAAKTKSAGAGA